MADYSKISDEELIRRLRGGEDSIVDYLLEKYKPLVRSLSRTRFIAGGDNDDLIQEGMIGLFKAVQNFDENKNVLFATFARMCIERQQLTAVTRSNRAKHGFLNNSEPLPEDSEDSGITAGAGEGASSPEMIIIGRESAFEMLEDIHSTLSRMEKEVFDLYIQGLDYTDIAGKLGKSPKSVDNAIQRMKKKIRNMLGDQ
ncbi:MAG: sigma-70 family RNA polymerase sigma factor [Lachnospiraceae bacterium]|jgi:RNA polymerase sporulation-specific sigma factor